MIDGNNSNQTNKKYTYVILTAVNSLYWRANHIFPGQDCNRWKPFHRGKVSRSSHHHCKYREEEKMKNKNSQFFINDMESHEHICIIIVPFIKWGMQRVSMHTQHVWKFNTQEKATSELLNGKNEFYSEQCRYCNRLVHWNAAIAYRRV